MDPQLQKGRPETIHKPILTHEDPKFVLSLSFVSDSGALIDVPCRVVHRSTGLLCQKKSGIRKAQNCWPLCVISACIEARRAHPNSEYGLILLRQPCLHRWMSISKLHIDRRRPMTSLSSTVPTNHLIAPDLGSENILREELDSSRQAPRSLKGHSRCI